MQLWVRKFDSSNLPAEPLSRWIFCRRGCRPPLSDDDAVDALEITEPSNAVGRDNCPARRDGGRRNDQVVSTSSLTGLMNLREQPPMSLRDR